MKRVFLFVATNLSVLIVLGIVLSIVMPLLGLGQSSYGGLLFMCAIFGIGGSFISLLMSKWIARNSTGAYVIVKPRSDEERWLLKVVKKQAESAGIGTPEVGMYVSPDINAFATGANRNNAFIGVSTGLITQMSADEAEAVIGHEISHIANGDMVTLTLIQGVLNTFVYFFARIVASALNRGGNNGFVYFMTVMALQAIFGVLASIIVMWFSRYREYRADAGGAKIAGKEKMIAALQRLQASQQPGELQGQLTAFGINGKRAMSTLSMSHPLMSHPPLDKRIAALRLS